MEECLDLIDSTVRACLIVSGQMGSILLPKISQLSSKHSYYGAVVFCGNVEYHKKWAQKCSAQVCNGKKVREIIVTDNFTNARNHALKMIHDCSAAIE